MSDKKFYYLQLESSLFSDMKMMMLDRQNNKKDLLYFLIQLSVISIKNEGKIMLDDEPASIETLSLLTGEFEEDVEKWIKTLTKLKLISFTDNTYVVDFASERIGSITDRAIRKQKEKARNLGGTVKELEGTKEELKGKSSAEVPQCKSKSYNKSKKLDIELEKELNTDKEVKLKKEKELNIVSEETLVVLDKPKKTRKDESYYFKYYQLWIDFLNLNNNPFKLVKTTENGFRSMIDTIKKHEKKGLTLDIYKEALQESQGNSWLFGDNDRNWKMNILSLMEIDKRAKLYAGNYKGIEQKKAERSFNDIIQPEIENVNGAPF